MLKPDKTENIVLICRNLLVQRPPDVAVLHTAEIAHASVH